MLLEQEVIKVNNGMPFYDYQLVLHLIFIVFEGPWSQFELGKLLPEQFSKEFGVILQSMTKQEVDVLGLLDTIHNSSLARPYPEMIKAIERIRANGLKTALITNNWLVSQGETFLPIECDCFDVVSNINCLEQFHIVLLIKILV